MKANPVSSPLLSGDKAPLDFSTPADLEGRWQVSQMTLRRWRAKGLLKASKFGRSVRISRAEVERFEREARG